MHSMKLLWVCRPHPDSRVPFPARPQSPARRGAFLSNPSRWALVALIVLPAIQAGEPIPRPNRITVAPRAAFNVKAGFTSSFAASAVDPGPATGGKVPRTYDDGFVGVDSGGNAEGKTWYWGYQNGAQVDVAADSLNMNALLSSGAASVEDVDEDLLFGGEVTYTRYLFEFGRAFWGLELGANFTPVSIEDSTTLTATGTAVRDAFSLGGITPPGAPYTGTFAGPGPVIGDSPVRTPLTPEVVFTGRREIEATTFALRFGPNLDVPMGEPLSLQISGGAYVMYADAEFTYSETASVAGQPVRTPSGRVEEQDWMLGAYVRGQVLLALSQSVGLFAGAEFLFVEDLELENASHSATLEFGESFAAFLGVVFTF